MESRIEIRSVRRWAAALVAVGLVWGAAVGHAADAVGPDAAGPVFSSGGAMQQQTAGPQGLAPVPDNPLPLPRDGSTPLHPGQCPCMQDLDSPCCPQFCCPAPNPDWWFDITGVMLRRETRGEVDYAATGPAGNIALSTGSLDQPFKGGFELSIGHTFKEVPLQIEISYMTLDAWDSTATYSSPTANLTSIFTNFGTNPGLTAPFDANNNVQIHEISRLEMEELNVRQIICMPSPCLSGCLIYGVRHVCMNEEFDYNANVGTTPMLGVSALANNDMWGPQLGGLAEFSVYKHCWLDILAKAAVLNDNVSRTTTATLATSATGGPAAGTYSNTRTADSTAFLGDFSVMFVYRPTCHLTLKGGYQGLFLDDVALASRNLAATPAALATGPVTLDLGGDVVYHGPRASVEFTW